jgi:hypothetical protein
VYVSHVEELLQSVEKECKQNPLELVKDRSLLVVQ